MKLSLFTPSHIPPRISTRSNPWFPPRCGFPPSVRIQNLSIRWSDIDVHITFEMIKEHCYAPGLFEHTFMAIISVPGLATAIAELDEVEGFIQKSPWLCERLPPVRCMIQHSWGPKCARKLIRYLHHDCGWSTIDFQNLIEPFVSRRKSNFFWNQCCDPKLKIPAPDEGTIEYDWFDRPWARSTNPTLILSQGFGIEDLFDGSSLNRAGRIAVPSSQPRAERDLIYRVRT
jgi:hypothetical protein